MMKITFMGAGSTVFVRNIVRDCLVNPLLQKAEFALYDIVQERLDDSLAILESYNRAFNQGKATFKGYLGVENRKQALAGSDFVINCIQVGFYEPCTVNDFEIPKKYGLRQTIADTLGIGGIMRTLRTLPVMQDFANDMQEVCPNAWFLNYVNPMAMLTGYMLRYTDVKTVGLCHSVQVCTKELFERLDMQEYLEGRKELIAGINHMGWLLKIQDKNGNDLYPEIKKRAAHKNATQKHDDMVRFDYIKNFGYYCTESSEHNAEYNLFYIRKDTPEYIEKFNIPLDEYPRRCVNQIAAWKKEKEDILNAKEQEAKLSREYASEIIEAMISNKPCEIGGNVLNTGLIDNLPSNACVEVPCLVNGSGIHPCHVGMLPEQLAAMNRTNINVQLLTIQAAVSKKREDIYMAAMLDPLTSATLNQDQIRSMVDELIDAHGDYMKAYR
ncbi:MAG: alpha-glucosidase/alpha-galactosidase [Eubacteriales bacterium]|nr:alpha-glucosidase/alpha-galactosidase [Eubacteriales bacterium]